MQLRGLDEAANLDFCEMVSILLQIENQYCAFLQKQRPELP